MSQLGFRDGGQKIPFLRAVTPLQRKLFEEAGTKAACGSHVQCESVRLKGSLSLTSLSREGYCSSGSGGFWAHRTRLSQPARSHLDLPSAQAD
ncbi:hypothetical protein CRENBAI_007903 [Crenichthys baileyi]|uniref:Uncharacterized protein n=1 Tax=Crenichthys baileyi TaxID=28760 RepID=A0AAV9SEQ6_9TELE